MHWQRINENGWQADEWRIARSSVGGEHHFSLYRAYERCGVFTTLQAAQDRAGDVEWITETLTSGGECDGIR